MVQLGEIQGLALFVLMNTSEFSTEPFRECPRSPRNTRLGAKTVSSGYCYAKRAHKFSQIAESPKLPPPQYIQFQTVLIPVDLLAKGNDCR